MSVNRENSVKFDDLVNGSMADKVGTVRVAEFEFQLCDHLQKVDGEEEYYATAFYEGLKPEGRGINGVYYKKMGALPVALLPLSLLKDASPIYKDNGQTEAMLARAVSALEGLNARLVSGEAAAESQKPGNAAAA